MTSTKTRVWVTVMAVLAVATAASGCSHGPDPDGKAPTARPLCETALPAAWQTAIGGGAIAAGGASTVPLAVGPGGETVAVRDNGDTRDLLMIGADKSITEIYRVPEPNRNNVGFAAVDERWIVVGVDRIPRNSNGVVPGLIRVDVIDRKGGPVRTLVEQTEDDYINGLNAIDSVAVFDGKLYAVTHDRYSGLTGVVRSFDLGTGAAEVVASGDVSQIRATAAGVTWVTGQGSTWQDAEVKVAAALPQALGDALGTGHDKLALATDGTAFAWITGLDQGVTGVAWWSPDAGPVRVAGPVVVVKNALPNLYVTGPYVVIGKGRADDTPGQKGFATVVDTRSGAVTELADPVAGADGGTVALWRGGYTDAATSTAVVLRTDPLPPLAC